ncbi:MAG: 3'(2'),5'-bisphosphate nucleotidase CysQ [Lentisphaeria bacterium]|nr:3'(2'),5'-bisphosphate nucleotidase CysQ [Lentisphaeria bacterium]
MRPILSPDTFTAVANLSTRAGAAIMAVYTQDFHVETKADASPLTAADLAAHTVICDGLNALSTDPVLSEESQGIAYEDRAAWTRFWLVDPLDGTKEFIKRNGEFTVNIALISGGAPVAGFVFAPVLKKLYCGLFGVGAFVTSVAPGEAVAAITDFARVPEAYTRLPKPSTAPAGTLRVVASRSHRNQETDDLIARLSVGHTTTEIVSSGSSLKLCLVAAGEADVYPRLGPTMEWDTGAAQAIVEAAGKTCVEFNSQKPLRYNKENLLNPYFIVS